MSYAPDKQTNKQTDRQNLQTKKLKDSNIDPDYRRRLCRSAWVAHVHSFTVTCCKLLKQAALTTLKGRQRQRMPLSPARCACWCHEALKCCWSGPLWTLILLFGTCRCVVLEPSKTAINMQITNKRGFGAFVLCFVFFLFSHFAFFPSICGTLVTPPSDCLQNVPSFGKGFSSINSCKPRLKIVLQILTRYLVELTQLRYGNRKLAKA